MDNLTHGITGVGIGYLVQELVIGPQPGLITCALLASQFPDLDVVLGAKGKTAYLKHHRGFSHSILFSPIYAALIAFSIKIFVPETSFSHLFLVSFLSLGLHLFLDLLNAYGTKLLWPLSQERYAWDVLMIVDPVIILIFGLGLGAYIYTGQEELIFSIYPLLGLYVLAMLNFRVKAGHHLSKNFRRGKITLLPPLLGCRQWNFIVNQDKAFYLGQVDSFTGSIKIKEELVPEKECSSVLASKEDPEVKIFLEFARFPWYSIEKQDRDVIIKWSDLRYRLRERDHFTLEAKCKE